MGVWKQSGFADFSKGALGNGGQNIYVSAKGNIQRVYRFDFNHDGYADALFATSQDMYESPPVSVYHQPLGERPEIRELPALGGFHAAVADLNGDGYDDLVVANQHNGIRSDVAAFVYFGSPGGLSERFKIELPAPNSRAVAIGDFNGDGRQDIAFASDGKLRLFYQTDIGFVPARFVTLDANISHMVSEDLDGDGYDDLYVRAEGQPRVYWGGPDGIALNRFTPVGSQDDIAHSVPNATPDYSLYLEGWTPKAVRLEDGWHLFRKENNEARFYPVLPGRTLGQPKIIADGKYAVSAAAADLDGDGRIDIVLASNPRDYRGNCAEAVEQSWIYWGSTEYSREHRTALPTVNARDVTIADLNGNGHPDIVVCQGRTETLYTTESLIYPGTDAGVSMNPVRLQTHDATAAVIGRTSDEAHSQLIFVNRITGRVRGDIPAVAYLGGKDGFSADRKIDFPAQGAVDGVCCDFNDDGRHDVLIVNCSENAMELDQGTFVYWGGPDGFRPDRRASIPTHHAHGAAVGDFRRSGYLDMVFGSIGRPELLLFRGGPDGFDTARPQTVIVDPELHELLKTKDALTAEEKAKYYVPGGEHSEIRWLYTADFNGDGWLDLFVSQCYGTYSYILWGGPEGFSLERSTRLATEGGICARAADLNGDGWLDLIVGGHQSISKQEKYDSNLYIYWGGPDGYREDRKTVLPAQCANSLAIADFNNDGILDIAVTSYHSGRARDLNAYIYWGQPGGVYSVKHRKRLFTHSSSGCMAIDFNEDGWVDLAVANHKTYGNHNGLSYVWWNGPDGFAEERATALPTSGPHGMIGVDPGNIMDRGPEEYYVSAACELPEGAGVTRVAWEADIPDKTWVKAQIRTADSREALAQAAWHGGGGAGTWLANGQTVTDAVPQGRWVQYKLALGAVNGCGSPRVSEVRVEFDRAG